MNILLSNDKTQLKKQLQKFILEEYKKGERILDILMECKRLYNLTDEEIKKLISKSIKDKMFLQEKGFKTVSSRATKVKPRKSIFLENPLD